MVYVVFLFGKIILVYSISFFTTALGDFDLSGLMALTIISGVYPPSQRMGPNYLEFGHTLTINVSV